MAPGISVMNTIDLFRTVNKKSKKLARLKSEPNNRNRTIVITEPDTIPKANGITNRFTKRK
tara:strand:- start:18416 stop:18598 length:183 start_codon:yes stop_codon:yes gene_type:complete